MVLSLTVADLNANIVRHKLAHEGKASGAYYEHHRVITGQNCVFTTVCYTAPCYIKCHDMTDKAKTYKSDLNSLRPSDAYMRQ